MNAIITTDDIRHLGTILGIWAHPDDETYTMGGIMAAAAQNGQKVICVTATRGEAGVQDEARWPAATLATTRSEELEAALKILGSSEHSWLDYPDGGCSNVPFDDGVGRIAECIRQYEPDSILTFGPEGMTGHPDHKTVSQWTSAALKQTGSTAKLYHSVQTPEQYSALLEADKQFNIFFLGKPCLCEAKQCGICFDMEDEIYNLKIAALKAMPSQTEAMLKMFGPSLRTSLGTEAFVQA